MGQTGKVMIGDRSSGHDNNFNLLRMLAATGVLVSHAYPISLGPDAHDPFHGLLKGQTLGGMSVLVFFAISGFFIAGSFARKSSVQSFVLARALRLFPALAVVLAITVVACAAITTESAGAYWAAVPEYYLRNLTFYLPKYELPGVFETNPFGAPINGSLWTLRAEVTFYIGVMVCGLLGLLDRHALFALALAGFAAMYGAAMATALPQWIDDLMFLALSFATGVAFWVWRERIPLSPALAVAGMVVAALSWPTALFMPVLTLAVSYVVFVIGFARLPGLAAYNRLGDYSYGTYVYAFPIQQGVAWFGVTSPVLNIAIALPITLVFAVLSWHLVEAPALKLKRRSGRARPPRQAAAE